MGLEVVLCNDTNGKDAGEQVASPGGAVRGVWVLSSIATGGGVYGFLYRLSISEKKFFASRCTRFPAVGEVRS